jgi:hypothetical protein
MMKFLAVLAMLAFASLPPTADSQDAYYGYGGDFDAYDSTYGRYEYGQPGIDSLYDPGPGGRSGTSRPEPPRGARGDERLWVPAPEYPPLDPYATDFSVPRAGPGLYEQLQAPAAAGLGARSPGAGGLPQRNPYTRPDRPRYRFRQPDAIPGGAEAAEVWHRGFRFRPLTEQERERATGAPGWRPPAPGYRRDAPASPARSAPHPEEAFGYQPDSWFQRYYGERY